MLTTSNLLNHTPNSPAAELRVLCLYRVSSNGQLYHNEKNEADIPMQRLECRRFADMMGWKIVYELQEEGISGHKVRAEQRDQIQKVKELAKQNKRRWLYGTLQVVIYVILFSCGQAIAFIIA